LPEYQRFVPGFAVDLDAGRDLIDGMSVPSKLR
jgi:hypothetical protein